MKRICLLIAAFIIIFTLSGCVKGPGNVRGTIVYETETCIITSEKIENKYVIRKYRYDGDNWSEYELNTKENTFKKDVDRLITEENT